MKNIFTLLAACLLSFSVHAQFSCGSDDVQQKIFAAHPELQKLAADQKVKWSQYWKLASTSKIINTANGPVYELPCVIHVMHTGGAIGTIYNPSDAQLKGMIDSLNSIYAATNTAYPDTSHGGTYLPIRFVLAKRGLACDTSTGIVRYNASSLAGYSLYGVKRSYKGVDDSTLKSFSLWPAGDYLNIWVVNKIDSADGTFTGVFTAGYAIIPPAPSYQDGLVVVSTQAMAGNIVLTHEIGHYLGLYHTFEGGSSIACPVNTNCSVDGDGICDTEPEKQSVFNCPANPNPCTGLSYNFVQHNFMDYSSCQDRFTPGQRAKMLYTLLNLRPSLITSLGGTYPDGTHPAAACIPGINNPKNQGDVGPHKVTLRDLSFVSGGYTLDNKALLDETCTQVAHLDSGNTYTISVTTGAYNIENVMAWIDYNNDGIFSSSEVILNHTGTAVSQTHTNTFTIPATGVVRCTPLRMRVMSDFNKTPQPCVNSDYGQAEDYTVYIGNSPSSAVSITTGTNPGCAGSALGFTATATNLGASPTYKWFVNKTQVTTGSTYSSTTLNDGDSLYVKAYGVGCSTNDSISSNGIKLSIKTVPASVTFTASKTTFCSGDSSILTTPTGTGYTYQWLLNGTNIAGATKNTYTAKTGGSYSVTVSNGPCQKTSAATVLTVNPSPTVTLTVPKTSICLGDSVTLTGAAVSGATYQWQLNGANISGATNRTYTVKATGTYNLVISNGTCSGSSSASINVLSYPAPTISATKTTFCANDSAVLTSTTGSGFSYQWQLNGTNIPGAILSTLVVKASGAYTVVVTNAAACNGTSAATNITVNPLPVPVITKTGAILSTGIFSSYQWYMNGVLITGATTGSYNYKQDGTYTVTVTDAKGCRGTSLPLAAVGVPNISLISSAIKIYPDPATSVIYINSPISVNVSLLTIEGKVILNKDNATEMDISALSKGVYIVRIIGQDGVLIKTDRIVKL